MAAASRRASLVFLAISGLFALHLNIHAQQPSGEDTLAAGITQVREGDALRALFTLNDAVSQLAGRPDGSAALARAHAYRALVYTGLDQPERARAAVMLALRADPAIAIASPEFTPAVAALFDAARRPTDTNPEATARSAEQAGRFQEAFLAYLSAYEALPDPVPAADDQRLREKIIKVVQKLDTKPAIPPAARDHSKKADDLLSADALLGGLGTSAVQQTAAGELRQAVRTAPWWPDATFKLATVLQKLQRFDEALLNLNLYKLADPEGYAAINRPAAPKPAGGTAAPAPVAAASNAPAVIYVYWLHTSRAMGKKPKTLCDGTLVATLANGRFIKLNAAPGIHNVKFYKTTVTLPFAAGQEHYLRASVEGYPAHLAFRFTSPDEGRAEMREKEITPNDPDRTFSAECKAPAPQKGRSR